MSKATKVAPLNSDRLSTKNSEPKVIKQNKQTKPDETFKKVPIFFKLWFYILLSIFGLGWILRLVIFYRSVSANFFLKKVILR